MKKVIDYLARLDFSEQESKLYLILLKTGSMTVAELARKAEINRTAAYGYINSLLKKGVIVQVKGATSELLAQPPAELEYLVEQKINSANVLKEELSPIITQMNAAYMRSKTEPNAEMRYYKGRISVKAIYRDVLKAKKIRAYLDVGGIEKTFPENAELFSNTIDMNHELIVYEIVQDSPQSRAYVQGYNIKKRHYWKFLPQDIKLTANDILIYDGKVAIINIGDENNVTGVVIENRDYYNNSVQLFDLLWRLLPERI